MLPTTFTETAMRTLAKDVQAILNGCPVAFTKIQTSPAKWKITIQGVVTPTLALTTREMTIYLQGFLDGQRKATDTAFQDGYDSAVMDMGTPAR